MKNALLTILILACSSLLATILLLNYYQVQPSNLMIKEQDVSLDNFEYDYVLDGPKSLKLELCNTDVKIITDEAAMKNQGEASMSVTATVYRRPTISSDQFWTQNIDGEVTINTCLTEYKQRAVLDFGFSNYSENNRNKLTINMPADYQWSNVEINGSQNNTLAGELNVVNLKIADVAGRLSLENLLVAQPKNDSSFEARGHIGYLIVADIKAENINLLAESGGILQSGQLTGTKISIVNEFGSMEINQLQVTERLSIENQAGELKINNLYKTSGDISLVNEMGSLFVERKNNEVDGLVNVIATNQAGTLQLQNINAAKISLENQVGTTKAIDCITVWEIENQVGDVIIEGGMILPGSRVADNEVGSIKVRGAEGELLKQI